LDNLDEEESVFHNSLHDYYGDRPANSEDEDTQWDEMTISEFVASYNIAYKSSKSKKLIKLQNGRGFIVKREKKCVIRYFLRYDNYQEYYRALCILFLPFRNEKQDIHKKDVELLYNENKENIEEERRKFEKHRDMVDILKEAEIRREGCKDLEEDEEEDNVYIEDETTSPEETDDFEKYAKEQAKKTIFKYNEGLEGMSDDIYLK
jgi:hypothetical protein